MAAKPKKSQTKAKARLTLIAEGDSWFNLPDFWIGLPIIGGSDYDLVRALRDFGHTVTSLAHWGHTLAQMVADRDWRAVLVPNKKNILLLSGGGNDLLGTKHGNVGLLRECLRQKPSGEDPPPAYYLNEEFYIRLDAVMLNYRRIIADIHGDPRYAKTRIVMHGYDYARDKKLAWIGHPMESRSIPEHRRDGVVKVLIDAFNTRLSDLAKKTPGVTYVNLRGTVGPDRWHDEIHPTREAFVDLARKLEKALRAL